jgi:hypothetical protein
MFVGSKTLPPITVGPCEPGQVVTEAALSIPSQVYAEVAFYSLFRAQFCRRIRVNSWCILYAQHMIRL